MTKEEIVTILEKRSKRYLILASETNSRILADSYLKLSQALSEAVKLLAEPQLEHLVQLHENINIFYVVDGWEAELWTWDGSREVASAKGETIKEALDNLLKELEKKGIDTLAKVRQR